LRRLSSLKGGRGGDVLDNDYNDKEDGDRLYFQHLIHRKNHLIIIQTPLPLASLIKFC
jgi:hypothetical protein